MPLIKDRYIAAMVLSGVGDAMGYKNGDWEFCHSGEQIHREVKGLGGVENLKLKPPKWIVSDDTVLHLATAEALVENKSEENKEKLYNRIAEHYKKGMRDMKDRSSGNTTSFSIHKLRPGRERGYCIPFNPRGGGCGAAMRAMCIGLRYPGPDNIDDLIAVSIESGRMTHHHPTGYLGALASALFTSFAIQKISPNSWGKTLIDVLPKAWKYVERCGDYVKENEEEWGYFQDRWYDYLDKRHLTDGVSDPVFPDKFGVKERDQFYKSLSFAGWGGSSGHDAPMIAYDAFLGSHGDWKELCSRGMFHGGDSDSTGVIAACLYGAMYGFDGVPECNYKNLEYHDRLKKAAISIYKLSKYTGDCTQEKNDKTANSPASVSSKKTGLEGDGGRSDKAEAAPMASQSRTSEKRSTVVW